jgi:hypothetical protein
MALNFDFGIRVFFVLGDSERFHWICFWVGRQRGTKSHTYNYPSKMSASSSSNLVKGLRSAFLLIFEK